jgi:hypothetical protein
MLWAVGRSPRLLFPVQLLERLTPEQRAGLLTHELAHLRRRDHWVRIVEFLVLGLYWWCPLVWWACAELREAEEECCDAWVVWALPGGSRAYALALVVTVDFLAAAPPDLPLLASGIGHVQRLKRRLTMILGGTTPRTLTFSGLLGLAGLGLLLLPLVPTRAQTPAVQRDVEKELDRIRNMKEELEKARLQLERQQDELEKRAQELRKAMERLQQGLHEKSSTPRPPQPSPAARPTPPVPPVPPATPFGKGPPPFAKAADLERRLQDLERKLEGLLHDIHELRRDMTKVRPGFGGFGPPGEKPFPGRKKIDEPRGKEADRPITPPAQKRPGFSAPPIPRDAPEAGPRNVPPQVQDPTRKS